MLLLPPGRREGGVGRVMTRIELPKFLADRWIFHIPSAPEDIPAGCRTARYIKIGYMREQGWQTLTPTVSRSCRLIQNSSSYLCRHNSLWRMLNMTPTWVHWFTLGIIHTLSLHGLDATGKLDNLQLVLSHLLCACLMPAATYSTSIYWTHCCTQKP